MPSGTDVFWKIISSRLHVVQLILITIWGNLKTDFPAELTRPTLRLSPRPTALRHHAGLLGSLSGFISAWRLYLNIS